MTKEEFKTRWESDAEGGGITHNDVAECAQEWGIVSAPKTMQMPRVLYSVLIAAGISNVKGYEPETEEGATNAR